MDNQQALFNIIAILTKKLGGKVVLTDAEVQNPPKGTVTKDYADNHITLEVET